VKTREDCFGPSEQLPSTWPSWGAQPAGENPDPDGWVAFWFDGEPNPSKAYTFKELKNNPPRFQYRPGTFRLEGKTGEGILFYQIKIH